MKFITVVLLVVFAAPVVFPIRAAEALSPPFYWPTASNPLVGCSATGDRSKPACDFCQLLVLFQKLIYFGLTLLLFAIAPILFAWGGFRILVDRGSEKGVSEGKKIITGTVTGVAIGLGSFLIVNTFLWLMGIALGGAGSTWSVITCG